MDKFATASADDANGPNRVSLSCLDVRKRMVKMHPWTRSVAPMNHGCEIFDIGLFLWEIVGAGQQLFFMNVTTPYEVFLCHKMFFFGKPRFVAFLEFLLV